MYPRKVVARCNSYQNINRLTGLLSGPDALQETITLGQSVEGVVALAHGADESAKGVNLVVTGVASVLVNLADGDLDRGVVLGLDDAVGGAALAWDQTVSNPSLATAVLLRFRWCFRCRPPPFAADSRHVFYLSQMALRVLGSGETNRSTSSPLSFSIFAVWVGEGVESVVGDVDCWTGHSRTNFANVVCVPPRGLSEKWPVAGAGV